MQYSHRQRVIHHIWHQSTSRGSLPAASRGESLDNVAAGPVYMLHKKLVNGTAPESGCTCTLSIHRAVGSMKNSLQVSLNLLHAFSEGKCCCKVVKFQEFSGISLFNVEKYMIQCSEFRQSYRINLPGNPYMHEAKKMSRWEQSLAFNVIAQCLRPTLGTRIVCL